MKACTVPHKTVTWSRKTNNGVQVKVFTVINESIRHTLNFDSVTVLTTEAYIKSFTVT